MSAASRAGVTSLLGELRKRVLPTWRLWLWLPSLFLTEKIWRASSGLPYPPRFMMGVWWAFAGSCGLQLCYWWLHRRSADRGDIWAIDGQRFDTRVHLVFLGDSLLECVLTCGLTAVMLAIAVQEHPPLSVALHLVFLGVQALLSWSVGFALWTNLRSIEALRALQADQPQRAEGLLGGLVRSRFVWQGQKAALQSLLGLARLEQGRPHEALSTLAAARHSGLDDAGLLEAGLRLGLGDAEMARACLAQRADAPPVKRARLDALYLSLAFHEDRADEVVSELEGLWRDAAQRPPRWRAGLGMVAAGVYAQAGRPQQALALLASLPQPERWPWLRSSDPRLWNTLRRLRGLSEDARGPDAELAGFRATMERDPTQQRSVGVLPVESVRFVSDRGPAKLLTAVLGLLALAVPAALAGRLTVQSWLRGGSPGPLLFIAFLVVLGVLSCLVQLTRWWLRHVDSGSHVDALALDDGSQMAVGRFWFWQCISLLPLVPAVALLLPVFLPGLQTGSRLALLALWLLGLGWLFWRQRRRMRLAQIVTAVGRGQLEAAEKQLHLALARSSGKRHRVLRDRFLLLRGWVQTRQGKPDAALQSWLETEPPADRPPELRLDGNTSPGIARVLRGWLLVARDPEEARRIYAAAPSFAVGEIFRRELLGALLALRNGEAASLLDRADAFAELGPRLASHERALLDLVWLTVSAQAGATPEEAGQLRAALQPELGQLSWVAEAFSFPGGPTAASVADA